MWLQFRPAQSSDPYPNKRECHSLVSLDSKLLLFGGNDTQVQQNQLMVLDAGSYFCFVRSVPNCLHAIGVKSETLTWTVPQVRGDLPPKRSAHSAAMLESNDMLVFGGWDGQRELNDVYIMDTGTALPLLLARAVFH